MTALGPEAIAALRSSREDLTTRFEVVAGNLLTARVGELIAEGEDEGMAQLMAEGYVEGRLSSLLARRYDERRRKG